MLLSLERTEQKIWVLIILSLVTDASAASLTQGTVMMVVWQHLWFLSSLLQAVLWAILRSVSPEGNCYQLYFDRESTLVYKWDFWSSLYGRVLNIGLSFLYKRVSLFLQNTTVVSKKGEIFDFCIEQLIKEQCTERNGWVLLDQSLFKPMKHVTWYHIQVCNLIDLKTQIVLHTIIFNKVILQICRLHRWPVVSKTSIFYFVSKHLLVGIVPFSVSLRWKVEWIACDTCYFHTLRYFNNCRNFCRE